MGWGMKHLKMMRWKGGKDGESALHAEWKNSGGWSMKGHCSRWLGWHRTQEGGGRKQRQLRSRDAMGALANCAGRAGRIGQPTEGANGFCGGTEEAGAAGVPRGHIRAVQHTSRSYLAGKNQFGPPSYCSVCPPTPAPQHYPATPTCHSVNDTWTSGWEMAPDCSLEPQG